MITCIISHKTIANYWIMPMIYNLHGKRYPCTGLDRPWGIQEAEVPRFRDNQHMKVVRLSTLRTDRLYLPGDTSGTHLCYRLNRPHTHSAAGRITSMKNSNDTIGNRTRDLPTFSAVPRLTAPQRAMIILQNRKPRNFVSISVRDRQFFLPTSVILALGPIVQSFKTDLLN